MPYIEEICMAGSILEVRKYHTLKFKRKGEKRSNKEKKTTDCQIKVNTEEARRNLRRLMNANFTDETGLLVTFTYNANQRPADSKQMGVDMRNTLKLLRKVFKKMDQALKYIYVKELGKRGAAHIHCLMSACPLQELKACWKHGFIDVQPLWSHGQYGKIADYFIKYAQKTIDTEGGLVGKRWNPSRNLTRPVVIKRVVKANTFNKKIKKVEGYVLDPTSVSKGITEFGYQYFSYSMQKAEKAKKGG